MNLLEMFKQLKEEEKIDFVNLIIDVINDCASTHKSSKKYEIICSFKHLTKN